MQTGLHGILGPTGVGNLRYRPAGRGARTRPAEAVLRDGSFSVKDFGAVGDGLTDDTRAIQQAINAAETLSVRRLPTVVSGGGGIWASVHLPKGNYLIRGVTITKPLLIFGDGRTQTFIKLADGANTSVFTSTLAEAFFGPCIFESLTIDGNGSNQSSFSAGINLVTPSFGDIGVAYGHGCILRHAAIHNTRDAGLFAAANRNDGVVADTLIYNCGRGVANSAFDWRLYSVDIGLCGYGYEQTQDGATQFWGCNIYQSLNVNVLISDGVTSYMTFTACSIDTAQQQGVYIDNNGQLDVATSFVQCHFTRNGALLTNTYPDVHCVDANSVSVMGCTFRYLGTPKPSYLIQFAGICGPVSWIGNQYQVSGGNAPFATAITSDITKLILAHHAGIRSSNALGGIGYSAGAGGTVAQATSKSTQVTLNTVCGQITMNNASLGAGTIVSFNSLNSAVAAGDLIVANHVSGGTPGAYMINAIGAAGFIQFNVRNNTAGALGEAIVIGYAVIKGVTS